MAALPYMQLYIADYLADTVHLEADEHGAYLLLMMNYFQTSKPIPKKRLKAISKISCNERWTVVEQTLSEFFKDTGTHWQHSRIDADLKMVEEAQKQRSKAGKASAEARKREEQKKNKAKNQPAKNEKPTTVERPLNEPSNAPPTNKDRDRDRDVETEVDKISINHADLLKVFSDFGFPLTYRTNPEIISGVVDLISRGLTVDMFTSAIEKSLAEKNGKGLPPWNFIRAICDSMVVESRSGITKPVEESIEDKAHRMYREKYGDEPAIGQQTTSLPAPFGSDESFSMPDPKVIN